MNAAGLTYFSMLTTATCRNRSWTSHPNGYYQPAVIAIDQAQRVLYRWRCVPKYQNMSGAGARPEAHYTLGKIREALANSGDAELDRKPLMGADELNWFQFLLILYRSWLVYLGPRLFRYCGMVARMR